MSSVAQNYQYACRITAAESERLAAFRGRDLGSIATDGWAIELVNLHGTLRLEPESMRTGSSEHPIAGVVRPGVVSLAAPGGDGRMRDVARDLGTIDAIRVESTIVTFSRPRKVRRTKLGGVAIPGGIEYRAIFRPPSEVQVDDESDASLVLLDVAVRLKVATHEVVVYSNGTGPFLSVRIDDEPARGWEKRDGPIREAEGREIAR